MGLFFAVFLLNAVITGLLWAFGPQLYLKSDYLKKKQLDHSMSLFNVTMTPPEAMNIAKEHAGEDLSIISVSLRSDFGRRIYQVNCELKNQAVSVVIDADSGRVLSPLDESLAVEVARQYVSGNPSIESMTAIDHFVHRGKTIASVFKIRFQQKGGSEIIVDRGSGAALEETDRAMRFHFWVMRLHQLNFFGFKKTLTIIPGLALLVMLTTGIAIWIKPKLFRKRVNR